MLYDAPIESREGDLPRKWISDDFFDLIVWYAPDHRVHGFQLCYDKQDQEKAITWIRGRPPYHSLVDTGDATPIENHSPVLVAGAAFPAARVRQEFLRRSVHLSRDLRRLILSRLSSSPHSFARTLLVSVVTGICLIVALKYLTVKSTNAHSV